MIIQLMIGIAVYAVSAVLLKWLVTISPQVENQEAAWPFSLYIQAASISGQVLNAFVPAMAPIVFFALIINWFGACHMMIESPWWYSLILGIGYIVVWIFCVAVFSGVFALFLTGLLMS